MQFPSGFYTSGSGGQQFAQRPMQMMAPGYPQQMMPQQMWGQPQPQYRSPPAGQAMYRQAQQVPQQMQQARRPATAPAPQYRNVGMQRVGQPLVQQQHQQQQQQHPHHPSSSQHPSSAHLFGERQAPSAMLYGSGGAGGAGGGNDSEASRQGVNSWLEEAYNMRLRSNLARPVPGVGE
mmetsp:Transcript_64801/g.148393  ORF Transcript_64801/g.148393 Transcript_64801/m.148393 type:complete len:178 (+) Transcript_64801:112-645(+)